MDDVNNDEAEILTGNITPAVGQFLRKERDSWLESRGAAGGTEAEFEAHVTGLLETDDSKRAALLEAFAQDYVMAESKKIEARLAEIAFPPRCGNPADDELVHVNHATVGDLCCHAVTMLRRAKTKAQRIEADRLMMAAAAAKERAGGSYAVLLRDIHDKVWPASETRQ
jgi:hypothetical protein